MTRDEKVAKAQRLRDVGLSYSEIDVRLGYARGSYVAWKLLNPEKTRESNRRQNAKRGPAKRAWENENDRGVCAECGGSMGVGARRKGHTNCIGCRTKLSKERRAQFVELRRQGLTNIEIAARFDVRPSVVGNEIYRAKTVNGMDVPSPPYWSRGDARAA